MIVSFNSVPVLKTPSLSSSIFTSLCKNLPYNDSLETNISFKPSSANFLAFKKFILTSVLLFSSLITIYPSKKENTNFFDYCYSLEKIISRNTLEKSKNLSKNFKSLAIDITLLGSNKTKGTFANKIIDQYKNSKKLFIITVVPNQIYCLAGYWIEEVSPGKFESIFYEKTKQKINEYKNTKKEVDKFIKEINLEYKSIKKEINDFF